MTKVYLEVGKMRNQTREVLMIGHRGHLEVEITPSFELKQNQLRVVVDLRQTYEACLSANGMSTLVLAVAISVEP